MPVPVLERDEASAANTWKANVAFRSDQFRFPFARTIRFSERLQAIERMKERNINTRDRSLTTLTYLHATDHLIKSKRQIEIRRADRSIVAR